MGLFSGFVRSKHTIPNSEILSIIALKSSMMNGMMPCGVDESITTEINLIVNGDRPEIDENESDLK